MTASSASAMIWSTAKSTEVRRLQTAFASRVPGPGSERAAGRRAAIVAIRDLLRGRAGGARGLERRLEIRDEVRLVLQPDGDPEKPRRDPGGGEGRRVQGAVRGRR